MRALLAAVQLLTTFPVSGSFGARDMRRAVAWYPLVGLMLGAVLAAAGGLGGAVNIPEPVLAVLVVALWALLTGGLHLDGLADTGDGLCSARPRERALEIMRDSRIGAMGVLALIFVLGLKTAVLFSLPATEWPAILLLAPALARCGLLWMLQTCSYARAEGMASTSAAGISLPIVLSWTAVLGVAALAMCGAAGVPLLAASAVVLLVMALWQGRRIGGYTGDTLGATCELAEAAILVAAAWAA